MLEKSDIVSGLTLNTQESILNEHSIVVITDSSGIIAYANDLFCNLLQYSREELIGQNHRMPKSGYHDLSFYENLWDMISSGKIWRGEIKNKR